MPGVCGLWMASLLDPAYSWGLERKASLSWVHPSEFPTGDCGSQNTRFYRNFGVAGTTCMW